MPSQSRSRLEAYYQNHHQYFSSNLFADLKRRWWVGVQWSNLSPSLPFGNRFETARPGCCGCCCWPPKPPGIPRRDWGTAPERAKSLSVAFPIGVGTAAHSVVRTGVGEGGQRDETQVSEVCVFPTSGQVAVAVAKPIVSRSCSLKRGRGQPRGEGAQS